MELERKSFSGIELKEDKPGSFVVKFATLDVIDKGGDVILAGSVEKGKPVLVSAYQHGSWMGTLPVGKATVKEAGNEAIAEGEFNLSMESGKEHYEAVKFTGNLQEWSFGFKVLETAGDEEIDEWAKEHNGARPFRIIKKMDIFEISPVLRGAGIGTQTIAIKNDKGVTLEAQTETALTALSDLVARVKGLTTLRREQGKASLSDINKERMQDLLMKIGSLGIEIETLLTEPIDDATALKLLGDFIKIESQILGVK